MTASGLPTEQVDQAFAFCLGTQILQNPASSPRVGKLSFKISPNLFDVPVSGNTVGATAIGLATSANTSNISIWSSTAQIRDNGIGFGVYAVSFAEDINNNQKVNVAAAGTSIASVCKNRVASGIDLGNNTFTSTSHGYGQGDAVVIASGDIPVPLATGITYYVIPSGVNNFLLAETRANAMAGVGSAIDLIVDTGGLTYLESDDVFDVTRSGLTGTVIVKRNGSIVHTFSGTTTATLRPFFWTRESSNSATIPVFKAIKVSGAS